MYGLIIENLASFIKVQWGEGKWDSVRKHAGIDAPSFSIHHVYAETLLNRLGKSAVAILGVDDKELFEAMGVYFVEYVGQYGYDKMMLVLGRHLRDFLNGLDNLHEYLKFSYTKMRAPSFYTDEETATGLRLHYRTKRRGFVHYVIGQIKQVAKAFYDQEVEIQLISESLDGETMHNIFQLTFDNQAFLEHEAQKAMMKKENQLPIRASIIFELFPFCIVFSTEMVITYIGHALLTILKDLVGQMMTEAFEIIRPLISFSFATILERRNNIFELITTSPIKDEALTAIEEIDDSDETEGVRLKLRGQMLMMEEWNMMLFLANPVMPELESLVAAGIFINDLSLHDCSRDLVLAGTQQSVELKLALDQEQHKSKKLEESMKKLDDEMKRTDELLYQMIPKQVADRLRKGENAVTTCEVFDDVSILFSDVVTFTDICSKISPLQVVAMLNHMYSLFDQLTERNQVYKVETIGDSYMVVSGAPDKIDHHAERICDMALDMMDAIQAIKNPSAEGEHLKLRVGCHSGMVVAGIVGVKMPRYCLFGDTVNTSSRMESTSVGLKIQISEVCKDKLPATYSVEERGTVTVKGKGEMKTYWLNGRDSRVPLSKVQAGSFDWSDPSQAAQNRRSSKSSDRRKSSTVTIQEPEAARSRDPTPAVTPTSKSQDKPAPAKAAQPSTSKAAPPPTRTQMPPPAIKTPEEKPTPQPAPAAAPPASTPVPTPAPTPTPKVEEPPPAAPAEQRLDLREAGNARARRLSEAFTRSRSPSPSRTAGGAIAGSSQPPPPIITITPEQEAKLTRQATVVVEDANANTTTPTAEDPSKTPAAGEGGTNGEDQDRESFLINVKMKKAQDNGDGGIGGIKRTINGIAVGISRLPKGEAWRKKIRENKITVVTADVLTDMGCGAFADKQRQVVSQACSIL